MGDQTQQTERPTYTEEERTLYSDYPAMLRSNPFGFFACWILLLGGLGGGLYYYFFQTESRYSFALSILLGLIALAGLVLLLRWWIKVLATKLIITNERTMLRRGILSRHTNEVFHDNVRNVQVYQSFMQRVFSVGNVEISSAGQADVEIRVKGLPDPEKIREIINQYREE